MLLLLVEVDATLGGYVDVARRSRSCGKADGVASLCGGGGCGGEY